jgi:hypothetical protein
MPPVPPTPTVSALANMMELTNEMTPNQVKSTASISSSSCLHLVPRPLTRFRSAFLTTTRTRQRKRFNYFQQQRGFVKKLAEICEKLRFLEKDVRGQFLKKDLAELAIPAFAYLPLCRSVDPWRHVLRCLPTECHAFSTKARCPALVLFEVEEATTPPGCDVATFLSIDLHEYTGAWCRLHLTDPCCGPLSAPPCPALILSPFFTPSIPLF